MQELVDILLNKTNSIYVPTGEISWRLPTGVPSLDNILGGGLPGGSITQIYGPEQSGKTSLAYRIAGESIRRGYSTLLVPLEGYSKPFAKACGIETEASNLHVISADFAELLFNTCIEAVRNYDTKVIVMDSIAAAIPRSDLEKKQKVEDGDPSFNVGTRAKAIGSFIQQMQIPLKRKEAVFVTVNRLTADINRYGGSMKPGGGQTLQYDSDIKISMWGKSNRDEKIIETDVTVMKGKEDGVDLFGATTLYFAHGQGVDVFRDLITVCEAKSIITKGGAWYTYGEQKFQGLAGFAEVLKNNKELYQELMDKVEQNIVVQEAAKVEKKRKKKNGEDAQ